VDRRILIICAASMLSLFAIATTAAEVSDRLRDTLGAGTYDAAGLDLLSEQELAVLEAWINGRLQQRPIPMPGATVSYSTPGTAPAGPIAGVSVPAGQATTPTTRSNFGLDFSDGESMESRITGEFRGWDGDTVFQLANGSIWEQVDNERLVVSNPIMNAAVTIERGYFGYRLRVDGYNSRVQVRRLE
jgi:hypothetical protein